MDNEQGKHVALEHSQRVVEFQARLGAEPDSNPYKMMTQAYNEGAFEVLLAIADAAATAQTLETPANITLLHAFASAIKQVGATLGVPVEVGIVNVGNDLTH